MHWNYAPANRHVSPELRFFATRVGADPIFKITLPQISLPVAVDEWRKYFERVQQDKATQGAFDKAARAELLMGAEELGEFKLVCERESSPLLWSVGWENHSYTVRLSDDTGEAGLKVNHNEFNSPDVPHALDPKALANSGLRIPESGGLYSASTMRSRSAIVLPPVVRQLGDLKTNPHLTLGGSSVEELRQLLTLRDLWSEARTTGDPISAHHRRSAVEFINAAILHTLYGPEWARAEATKKPLKDQLAEFKTLIWDQPPGTSLGAAIFAKRGELAAKNTRDRVREFSRLAKNYLALPLFEVKVADLESSCDWIAEFALRLATAPDNALAWSDGLFPAAIDYVFRFPQLARSARMLALSVASFDGTQSMPIIALTQWGWE